MNFSSLESKELFKRFESSFFSKKNSILTKYIFKELFYYFFICFIFLFVIFFANQILLIGEQLLSKRAPFLDVCKIMFYSTPAIIAQSTPFATLVGFLMCLGRMASDNEILICRASGFSFRTILKPVMILGLIISIISFFVNDYLLPLSTIKYNELFEKIARSTPTIILEPNSVKRINGSTVVIGDVEENKVSDIIFFSTQNDGNEQIIVAGNSILQDAKKEGVLLQLDMNDTVLTNIKIENRRSYDVIKSENMVLNIFDSVFNTMFGENPREMTFIDLNKRIKQMEENGAVDNSRLNFWKMELHKKFAIPFGSIFFAFLAFSIAFLFGKHNGLTLGLFIGIVICVFYWAVNISGQLLVVRVGMDSFLCIWGPNILIGIVGLILSTRLIKK